MNGPTERLLVADWQPLTSGALDGIANVLDRLGGEAAINRKPATSGGYVVTVCGTRAGQIWAGEGCTVGDALRNLTWRAAA